MALRAPNPPHSNGSVPAVGRLSDPAGPAVAPDLALRVGLRRGSLGRRRVLRGALLRCRLAAVVVQASHGNQLLLSYGPLYSTILHNDLQVFTIWGMLGF